MNIKKLEEIFENNDITILKNLRPEWYISLNKNLSDKTFLVYEIKIANNKYHIVKNIQTGEFGFVLNTRDIRGIYNIKEIIPYLEGTKSINFFSII